MAQEPHIFTVDGESFVLGLFWQPLSAATPAEQAKEIRALAQELSFDMAIVRNASSSMSCAGFAKSSQVIKAGLYSAAAVLSKSLDVEEKAHDFIFVSRLPDGRWAYVAQRDGIILPDGDTAFASEDAARARLLEHMSLGDWPKVFAPAIWGVNGAIERDLIDLIPRKRGGKIKAHKWWRLLPVGRRRTLLSMHAGKSMLVGGVIVAVVGGGLYYKQWKAERDARLAAEAAAAAAMRDASGAPIPPENPWKKQPPASEMLHACLSAISSQRLFPGNWNVNSVECANGQMVISWTPREGGWIKHLREVLPDATIAIDGSMASLSVSLPEMHVGRDEQAPAEKERLITMYSAAQAYGVSFTAKQAESAFAQVLPGQEAAAAAPPAWREISWVADGVTLPSAVLTALDGPGFRMKSMRAQWVDGKFVWTMEGMQYVQP